MRLAIALALASIVALGACRGDPVKCDQGCRNYATLVYWKHAEAKITAAPADQRDAMRKQQQEELDRYLEQGVPVCVRQCQSANNTDQTDCMIAAKTADQATACQ
ncbi:MAG TPA: hypothetical protein VLM79_23460 [Kofleriaceae bacterium]|nr:hypothetical protein [Kofleriaceae bacterium]